MEYKDYYKTLNLEKTADKDQIRKSYRSLRKKYHPDISKEVNAEAKFKDVQEAYEVLSDPAKRREYDSMGSGGFRGGDSFGRPSGYGGSTGGFDNNSGFSDFFDTFFGRGSFDGSQSRRKPKAQTATISLDLEDVFSGASKRIRIQGGDSVQVKIPKGIEEGKKIRLAGKASNGGDLLLQIQINKHPKFRLEGKDVYVDLPLAPWESTLGTSVTVPTLGGSIKLTIPEGAKSGSKMRLKGKGLPSASAGDQYVVIKVVTPPAKTEEQRALYKKMQDLFEWDPRQSL